MENKIDSIRIAAVLYADENEYINSTNIVRKIVCSLFLDNSNKELSIDEIIDLIKVKLSLDFDTTEILKIIKSSSKNEFFVREDFDNNKTYIKLSKSKLESLLLKKEKYDIFNFIKIFEKEIYKGNLPLETLESSILKFLYELLNKNINAFNKIISSMSNASEILIDPSIFLPEERNAINDFLNWENHDKNKSIFNIISYSIEYCLICNKVSTNNNFVKLLKNKTFYLDNNIIYRAIGVNGVDNMNRIKTFLRKCKECGQELKISIISLTEFKATINYHIDLLKKVNFNKINPKLFEKYSLNKGVYEFYHTWRNNRQTESFEMFHAYVLSLYDSFKTEFGIQEDFSIPYDEKNNESISIIDNYTNQIKLFKENPTQNMNNYKFSGSHDTHIYDAKNTYWIEVKRKNNNLNIVDTRYYFVSADRKLRLWDFNRNNMQPIALLPSQWLAILLKFYSRATDDFKSYIKFLRLRPEEPLIEENKLHYVLSGISEITEDYSNQQTIFERMIDVKFTKEINDIKDPTVIKKKSTNFAKEVFDSNIMKMKDDHHKEIHDLSVQKDNEKIIEKKSYLEKHIQEIQDSLKNLNKIKDICIKNSEKRNKNFIFKLIAAIFLYAILMVFLIFKFSWNSMEPIVWIGSFALLILGYLYIAIHGKSFNPIEYLKQRNVNILKEEYKLHSINEKDLEIKLKQKEELEDELSKL